MSVLERKTALGSGTVLVVDEEDIIRELLEKCLKS